MDNTQETSPIVQDDELLRKKTKSVPKPKQRKDIDTEGKFFDNIIGAGTSSQLDITAINSFSQVSQNRDELYNLIDSMCEDSTVAAILETYAEDATEYNENGDIIWATSDDANIGKYITYLLNTMQVNKYAYEWVYSLCKYGDLYLQLFRESEFKDDIFFGKKEDDKLSKKLKDAKNVLNEDIYVKAFDKNDSFVHYIEAVANPAEMFELTRLGKTSGYIKADVKTSTARQGTNLIQQLYRYNFRKGDVYIHDATKFVHAALTDDSNRHPEEVNLFMDDEAFEKGDGIGYKVKKGQSLLYNTFKIWRELALLENSLLLNRITKSSIVRLINVEVGDMPKEQVGPHLQGIKQLMEQKSAINTGKSMSEYTNPGPIENNIYVPTKNQMGTITVGQVGGDVNVSQIPDIDYFQNKFFGAMRVPKQFFGLTDDGAGFSGGESLAIISSRYAKMIKRIQNALIQALTSAINIMLIDKGQDSYINQFTIHMQPPTTREEIDRRDNMASRIQIVGDIMNLVSDVEDAATKLKILKALISNVINDDEVISLIQDEIDKLEDELQSVNNESNEPSDEPIGPGGQNDFAEPMDLDAELGLDNETDTSDLDNSSEEDAGELPTPEELGLDMTDNNINSGDTGV